MNARLAGDADAQTDGHPGGVVREVKTMAYIFGILLHPRCLGCSCGCRHGGAMVSSRFRSPRGVGLRCAAHRPGCFPPVGRRSGGCLCPGCLPLRVVFGGRSSALLGPALDNLRSVSCVHCHDRFLRVGDSLGLVEETCASRPKRAAGEDSRGPGGDSVAPKLCQPGRSPFWRSLRSRKAYFRRALCLSAGRSGLEVLRRAVWHERPPSTGEDQSSNGRCIVPLPVAGTLYDRMSLRRKLA